MVLIILNVISLVPCVGCFTFILSFVAYVGVGVLAANFMTLPRNTNSGATNGAIAAAGATLIAGVVNIVITSLYAVITGSSQLAQIPSEQLAALSEVGIDPAMLAGPVAVAGIGTVCCGIFVLIAAALGAAGGAFWGNSHPS